MTASDLPHGIQAPPPHAAMPRFHLLLIGDELLSGRRQDKHVPHTIQALAERGLTLGSVRIVGDGGFVLLISACLLAIAFMIPTLRHKNTASEERAVSAPA